LPTWGWTLGTQDLAGVAFIGMDVAAGEAVPRWADVASIFVRDFVGGRVFVGRM
jgi:hypothetical protein